jgi:hypothetical protein
MKQAVDTTLHCIPSTPWLSGMVLAITDWILQHTKSVTSSSLSKEFRVSDRFLCSHSQSFSISVNVSEQAITKHNKNTTAFSITNKILQSGVSLASAE